MKRFSPTVVNAFEAKSPIKGTRADGPLSAQVKTWLLSRIANKDLGIGDRIPSERELGELCSVSRMTARQALSELASDGVISRHVGQGSFVAGVARLPRSASVAVLMHSTASIGSGLSAFQQAAYSQGFNTVYFDLGLVARDPAREQELLDRCLRAEVAGIAIWPTPLTDNCPLYESIRAKGVRVALFVPTPHPIKDLDWCFCDYRAAGAMAAVRLQRAGYRRVLYAGLGTDRHNEAAHLLALGVQDAVVAAGQTPSPHIDLDPVFCRISEGTSVIRDMLGGIPEAGTAYVVFSPLRAQMLTEALRRLGLQVPQDCGVVTFDEGASDTDVTRVVCDQAAVMRNCAGFLTRPASAGGNMNTLVAPRLVEGSSAKPVPRQG